MRWWCIALGLLIALPALPQDAAPRKRKAAPGAAETKAHRKPTKEQIRRFNELQKKQAR